MWHAAWGTPSIFDKSPLVEHSHKCLVYVFLFSTPRLTKNIRPAWLFRPTPATSIRLENRRKLFLRLEINMSNTK